MAIKDNLTYFYSVQNLILALCSCLFTLGLLEGGVRTFHSSKHQMTFWYDIQEEIYRSLSDIKKNYDEKKVNILLLGGSVLDDVAPKLKEVYQARSDIQVFDMAAAAHSTRDSRLKLDYLTKKGYQFDYIIFYHGINDARANNVPPHMFQEDYSHYFYYSQINPAFNPDNIVLGLLLKSAIFIKAYQSFFYYLFKDDDSRFVPAHNPREKWVKYGSELRTSEPFKENLSRVINNATKTKAKLIVPRFATFLPENYDQLKHKNNELGYAKVSGSKYYLIADAWGKPENVRKAVKAHNDIIESLKDRFIFIDTSSLDTMGNFFVDPCHFSESGIDLFVKWVGQRLDV